MALNCVVLFGSRGSDESLTRHNVSLSKDAQTVIVQYVALRGILDDLL